MRNDNGNYLDVQLDISAHQSLPAVATNVQFTQSSAGNQNGE